MTKKEFLEELHRLLSDLPWDDVSASVEFYEEMIEDRKEEGLSEEEAVAQAGIPAQIAARIRLELPAAPAAPAAPASAPAGEKTKRGPLFLILLICGLVIWIPLLAAAVAVGVSLVASLIAVFVSLWAVVVALGGSALLWLGGAVVSLLEGYFLSAGMLLGCSLFAAGLCVLSVFLCRFLTKKAFGWTKNGVKKVLDRIRERRWVK